MPYQMADYEQMRKTGYGVGAHWTTWTYPKNGSMKPFEQAVNDFDVKRYVSQIVSSGAGHVIFTLTHQLHWMPCPNPAIDKILTGRTCKRDLVMEIADELAKHDIQLVLYYHHGIGKDQDPEWLEATGGALEDRSRFYDNYCKILGYMGERYGNKVIGFWLDAGYDLNERPNVPWERLTAAAKIGNPNRLVTYNSGLERQRIYTKFQDYWAGEINRLNFYPRASLTSSGMPWYAFTSWHAAWDSKLALCGEWGIDEKNHEMEFLPPAIDSVIDYYKRFQKFGGIVCFNLLCYQEGILYQSDLDTMVKFASWYNMNQRNKG